MASKNYTLYIDPCGDQGWPAPFGQSKVDWYVVGGLAITPEADYKARLEVERLLREFIPVEQQRKFPESHYEIHYHDIIYGKLIFNHLDHPQRKALSDKIFELIRNIDPILFATAINKKQMKRVYGTKAYHPRSLGLQATIARFSMFLRRKEAIGQIIVDQEEYRKDKELQQMISEFRRSDVSIRGWNWQPRYFDNLSRVLNTISFTPSWTSPGIQLADVISRSVWTHFERGKSNRFNELSDFWQKNESTVYDPSVIPSKARWV